MKKTRMAAIPKACHPDLSAKNENPIRNACKNGFRSARFYPEALDEEEDP